MTPTPTTNFECFHYVQEQVKNIPRFAVRYHGKLAKFASASVFQGGLDIYTFANDVLDIPCGNLNKFLEETGPVKCEVSLALLMNVDEHCKQEVSPPRIKEVDRVFCASAPVDDASWRALEDGDVSSLDRFLSQVGE
jgi:hypothetical protein